MNSVALVGRLTDDPEVKESADGIKRTVVTIAVSRDYKNSDGIYETDFIRCVLWNGIASATKNYCHKGDIVGVRGKIQTRKYENAEKETKYITEVIVDKVSFLSGNSKDDELK